MIGEYCYKEEYDNRGNYVGLKFEIDFIDGEVDALDIKYLADTKWELMCRAGVVVFYDYFKRDKYFNRYRVGKLIVTIQEVKWFPVDTNNLIVLFASIKALCDALNLELKNLRFDANMKAFHFPELRSI